ncbi:ABC transporter ATP-binding protein [Infirmifilum sp. NZ]|uniref:ABC transporter ATP-binding protein n=1 Tax=Infirmifilum sp. NZ TaxID=2926850 RepID=UPI00279BCEF7|nr:ABC transporter ATP-binding protein [Infirmifilum sp. NZ]UNQ73902.1 ABC transporter ATP-binding protein [Infirmifilum sp. NZ]
MVGVRLENVEKYLTGVKILDNISFEVKDKEFFTLIGPSGCGKTTTLRIIAGLLKPDKGNVYFDGRLMNDVPPEKRNITMVFQNFALMPHMTVFDNIAFGLKMRGWSQEDIKRRVREVMELLRIEGLENKKPHQLSGGQQQRVGVARALAPNPDVILFDEPLSNVDAVLREQLRFEIRDLMKKLGITSIYVTHDQAEALVVSDRLAIMSKGRIIQIGTPDEIYRRPANTFVAGFLGVVNLIKGRVVSRTPEGYFEFQTSEGARLLARESLIAVGGEGFAVIRPEHIQLEPSAPRHNVFEAIIVRKTFLGSTVDVRLSVANLGELRTFVKTGSAEAEKQILTVYINPDDVIIVPEATT